MAEQHHRIWPLIAIAALAVASCGESGPPAPAAPASTGVAAPAIDATNLIAPGAGWECVTGARIADGKLVIEAGPAPQEATVFINDFRIRLQPREDVRLSLTVEADARPGLAGIKVWNSLPPPQAPEWWANSPQLTLGVGNGRAYMALQDATGAKPAFQHSSKPLAPGPVSLVLQRSGNALLLRVGDSEEATTTVLGPFAGGPLYLGASVQPGKTLTIHRLALGEGTSPRGVEVMPVLPARAPRGAAPGLRDAPGARDRLIGAFLSARQLRWNEPYRDTAAREFNLVGASDGVLWPRLRPTRDRYDFCAADQLVAFAEANSMRVHAGHLA